MLYLRGSLTHPLRSEANWSVPAVCFVNKNVPEERTELLLPKKKLNELPDNNTNIDSLDLRLPQS